MSRSNVCLKANPVVETALNSNPTPTSKPSETNRSNPESPDPKSRTYEPCVSGAIQWVYLGAIFVWILIILFMIGSTGNNWLSWLILLIPLVIFAVGIYNANSITFEVENMVFQSNYFAFGLLIVVPLLTWLSKDYVGNRQKFINILIAALILAMLGLLDLWVTKKWLSTVKHTKSVLQTMSLILIIYALYIYYLHRPQNIFNA